MKKFQYLLWLLLVLLLLGSCESQDFGETPNNTAQEEIPENNTVEEETPDNTQENTVEDTEISREDIEVSTWVEWLDTPWELVFLDENRALVTQRPWIISLIENGIVREEPYWEAPSTEFGEEGLMGLEKDPNFTENWYLYAMYGTDDTNREEWYITKVVRLSTNEDGVVWINRVLINNIPAAKYHDGGRIKFWPDGKLYITTGDATDPNLAQSLDSLAGKILRINSDGTTPLDNPIEGSLIYSYGHRNPQWIAWNQAGDLFMSTHGPSWEFGLTAKDRVDYIIPGTNYGWPEVYGPNEEWYPNPIAYWPDTPTPPGWIVFWNGSLFVPTMKSEVLIKLNLEKNEDSYQLGSEERWFEWEYGRLRNIVEWPDGNLYLMTTNDDGRGWSNAGDDIILQIKRK